MHGHAAIRFNSELSLVFMTKALKRGENSTRQRLFGAFSYIFIFVRLFDAWTALFIKRFKRSNLFSRRSLSVC